MSANSQWILEHDPYAEKNPYEILGVDRDADRGKIKSAYRALQKHAKRGDELWTSAQVANEALTKPRKRLLIDLFIISEKRLYDEIVRRYGEISFELVPRDLTSLIRQATDLESADPFGDFAVPLTPKITFQRLLPPLRRNDGSNIELSAVK